MPSNHSLKRSPAICLFCHILLNIKINTENTGKIQKNTGQNTDEYTKIKKVHVKIKKNVDKIKINTGQIQVKYR